MRELDDDTLKAYRKGVETGTMKHATPNTVRALLDHINWMDTCSEVAIRQAHQTGWLTGFRSEPSKVVVKGIFNSEAEDWDVYGGVKGFPGGNRSTLFHAKHTRLEEIRDAGFSLWTGTGGWYGFENGRYDKFSVPHWVKQLVSEAEERGRVGAITKMRQALGFKK